MTPKHPAFSLPYLGDRKFVCFAHRGGGGERAENTMAAFRNAADLGYEFIETDIQATADGVLIIYHDDTLNRLTDLSGVISQLPWSTVCKARIAGEHKIITLQQAIDEFPAMRFNIDIKTDHAFDPAIEFFSERTDLHRFCLAATVGARIKRIRRAMANKVATNAGSKEVAALRFRSWGMPLPLPKADLAQVPLKAYSISIITPAFVRCCHRHLIPVHVWTIDDEATMRRLIRMGVDGIVTDYPTLLRRVAEEEGVWQPITS